ncbi:MAG: NAD(P)-dependent oxidoreductase [Alphaproteobacteria bacterium]|nr:NAD(P)-dependent oxidoreductase [Alphaproteobacteria bacterium]
MKILITGANGYIGKHVVSACQNAGLETYIVDRKDRAPLTVDGFYKFDVLENGGDPKLYDLLGRPDAIIHLAWQDGFNHKADSHIINLPKHYIFLKNMIDSGCKILSVMGSMHEVGYHEGEINSETPCNPMSLYGIAKNALRQAILTYAENKDVRIKWLRGYYITGDDRNNHSIFSKILEMSQNGQKSFPFTSGTNKYDFLDIKDVAQQIVTATLDDNISGVKNICSGKPVSLKEKVEQFIQDNKLDIVPEYGRFPTRKYDSPAIWGYPDIIKHGESR